MPRIRLDDNYDGSDPGGQSGAGTVDQAQPDQTPTNGYTTPNPASSYTSPQPGQTPSNTPNVPQPTTYAPGTGPTVSLSNPSYTPGGTVSGGFGPQGTPQTTTSGGRLDDSYILSQIAGWSKIPGSNPSLANDPSYWLRRIKENGGLGSDNLSYWQNLGMRPEGAPESWSASNPSGTAQPAGQPIGQPSAGGSVFSDPATAQWEQLVRSLTDRLNQPTQNPDYNPLVDYMRQYFAQLQQPVYTPAQQDLIQTQTLDPLERQRQARKQQTLQVLASRGITPGSGPAIQALADVDRQFDQMRTQAQGQFTTNEIAQGKQNQAQALNVGTNLSNMQNQTFATNEQRALQGLDIFGKIPALADSRLGMANNVLSGSNVNPAQLLNTVADFSKTGSQALTSQSTQDQAFWNQIGAALAKLFGK